MKKIAMFIAAAAIAVSANAQQKKALTGQKWSDNTYIGITAGAQTSFKSTVPYVYGQDPFKQWQPEVGIRIGKNFTPVFGLALEGNVTMNAQSGDCNWTGKTFIQTLDVELLGTFNMMNLFGGYKGEPRPFEITALYGFGWGHWFGMDKYAWKDGTPLGMVNAINSKVALDFAYNFGKNKEFQVFIEPGVTFAMQRWMNGEIATYDPFAATFNDYKPEYFQYNANRAKFDLKAGFIYKFKCSNGKHNFAYEALEDPAELDALNAKINGLRGDLDAANAALAAATANVAALQKALTDCQNKPVVVVKKRASNLQPSVVFAQGKSVVEKSQMANIEMIANYMKHNPDSKVKISGYASPEGSKEINDKLSKNRANNVKNILVNKYKISADRLEAEGLGATDKLFDEVEFNRVVLFNDTTK